MIIKYDGAKEFLKSLEEIVDRKTLNGILCEGIDIPIEVSLRDKSILQLQHQNNRLTASRTCSSTNSINFEFTFMVDKVRNTIGLWPLILKQKGQPDICCITTLKNKELINVSRQSELIPIANMWGKNLRAQKVASFLDQSATGVI